MSTTHTARIKGRGWFRRFPPEEDYVLLAPSVPSGSSRLKRRCRLLPFYVSSYVHHGALRPYPYLMAQQISLNEATDWFAAMSRLQPEGVRALDEILKRPEADAEDTAALSPLNNLSFPEAELLCCLAGGRLALLLEAEYLALAFQEYLTPDMPAVWTATPWSPLLGRYADAVVPGDGASFRLDSHDAWPPMGQSGTRSILRLTDRGPRIDRGLVQAQEGTDSQHAAAWVVFSPESILSQADPETC